jgi:hypothetical protein
MRSLSILCPPVVIALLAIPAGADVVGGDFDILPVGPYPFGASPRILLGNPFNIQIIPAGNEDGAPTVPGGDGHVLCIDLRLKDTDHIVEFDFSCEKDPTGICQVKWDFSAASYIDGHGFDVFIDADGDYTNTDQTWHPPVIIDPSTIEGSNTEGAGVCDASTHTVTFIVNPGVAMYIDNLRTVCEPGSVSTEEDTWGGVKARYFPR